MEFRYRADDDRGSSPPPLTASSASADGHRGGGGDDDEGGCVGDSDVALRQPTSPAAAAADGRDERRRVTKERIRERILREEAEHLELEAEVRRELMEQLLPLLGSGNALLAGTTTAPIVLQSMQSLPAKRKSTAAAAAASAVSAPTSSKRPKHGLTCAVCGITSTSEKAMQEHLDGKSHKRKAAAAALPQQEEDAATVAHCSDGVCTPTKLTMLTSADAMDEVLQMDGYILCEACNVRTNDRVTMMCHLEGAKHISKTLKLKRQARKPPALAEAACTKGVKASSAAPAIPAAAPADGEAVTVVIKIDGAQHTLRQVDDGFLLCELCNVKAPSVCIMQSHLTGKKHKSMAAKAAAASAGTGSREETAATVASKVAQNVEAQETGAMAEDVAATVDGAPATASASITDVPESVVIVIDGEQHIVLRVGGSLCCARCNVTAPSEDAMRSHLAGEKHKNKARQQKEVAMAKAKSKETSATNSINGQAAGGVAPPPPLAARQCDAVFADGCTAPIEVNKPSKIRDGVRPANDEEKAGADIAAAAQEEAAAGQEVKIQVEGRMFVVLRKADSTLVCEPCGANCQDKGDMVQHL